MSAIAAFDQTALPAGIRSRFVDNINGLTMHMLEAGYAHGGETRDRPASCCCTAFRSSPIAGEN